HLAPDESPELEQREPQAVLAVARVLLEHALVEQRRGETVHRALCKAEALCEIADADLVMVLGESADEAQRVRDRGEPRTLPGPAYFADTRSFQCLSHFSSSSTRATGSSIT